MSREKQIEEMTQIIQKGELDRNRGIIDCSEFPTDLVIKVGLQRLAGAKALCNAGYRKASEVAEEIFAEIEKTLKECLWFLENHPSNYPRMDRTKINVYKDNLQYISELKKKYTEGGDINVLTKESEGRE